MKQHFDPNETPLRRRIRIASGVVAVVLTLLFAFWAGWGWLVALPLVVDYYFFKYIHWGWGRNHPNKLLRHTIAIVGDVVYVVVAVTFVFTFFFQNFAIPSSSLEKTLLTGDYLFVSKIKYGPRMPMTPLALPLVHNRFLSSESYSTTPTLGYRRLKGTGQVERGDLVVFNFPAGDTVALNMPNPDYLTLCALYGREQVWSNRAMFGDVIYRPVDRRDHYVKRCIGMPGDTLQIIDAQVYIDGKAMANPSQLQLNYFVQTDGTPLGKDILDRLEINYRDVYEGHGYQDVLEPLGTARSEHQGDYGLVYEMPLTSAMRAQLEGEQWVKAIKRVPHTSELGLTYPLGLNKGWSVDDYGPLVIPRRGMRVALTSDNYLLYERCIRAYEGHQLERRGENIYIDGKEATHYTFEMDYYFMMGDNRHNSADSRAWGFVPEDHIVGQPALIWLSINDEQGLFSGMLRLGRMLRLVNAD